MIERPERVQLGLSLLILGLLLYSLFDLRSALPQHLSGQPGMRTTLAVRLAPAPLGLVGALLLAWRLRRGLPQPAAPTPGFALRLLSYGATLGVLVPTALTASAAIPPYTRLVTSVAHGGLLAGLNLWVVLVQAFPQWTARGPRTRPGRYADLVLFNVLAGAVFAEAALAVTQRLHPNSILYDDSTAASTVDSRRGGWNSLGYFDDEFFRPGPDDFVVGLVGDSFGVGIVPQRYNFVVIAEQVLQQQLGPRFERVAIHNFSLDAIDMPEYVYLLQTEVLPSNPSQVVLCVFVGNDIGGLRQFGSGAASSRIRLQNWLLVKTTRRLWRVLHGIQSFGAGVERPSQHDGDDEDAAYHLDPSLEEAFMTQEAFLQVEANTLELCNTESEWTRRVFASFLDALELVQRITGPRLRVLLIPDSLQVNDDVYSSLLATHPDPHVYDRDQPQRLIGDWCREHQVRLVDPLPALRAAESGGRTYHLHDTHWNARGNAVAARELAAALLASAASP